MSSDDIIPLSVGAPAPDFSLPDVLSQGSIKLSALQGHVVVINFWSVECPWSRHYDAYLAGLPAAWDDQDVRLLLIDSNLNESIEVMRQLAGEVGMPGPLLHDADCAVANAYGALTTPHIFIVDQAGKLAYQGAIDDRNFRQREATVNYLDAAVEALLAGRSPDPAETPAYGCTIVRHGMEE